jgi:O-antigen/teichoic acid export membrane protein
MPLVVRALFTTEFMASVPMAICAILFMFFKALTLPVAYLPLAKGDSKIYMLTELIYDIFVALAVPYAFKYWGLMGAGSALSVGGFLDMLIIHSFYRYRYHYRFNKAKLGIYIIQFILLLSVILLSLQAPSLYKWIGGILAFILSLYISLHILSKETNIISTLKKKLRRK